MSYISQITVAEYLSAQLTYNLLGEGRATFCHRSGNLYRCLLVGSLLNKEGTSRAHRMMLSVLQSQHTVTQSLCRLHHEQVLCSPVDVSPKRPVSLAPQSDMVIGGAGLSGVMCAVERPPERGVLQLALLAGWTIRPVTWSNCSSSINAMPSSQFIRCSRHRSRPAHSFPRTLLLAVTARTCISRDEHL